MTQDDAITVEPLDAPAARDAIPALAGILADAVENGASVGFRNWNGLPDYAAFWTGVAAEVEAGRTP